MIEAVGWRDFPTFFARLLRSCCADDGVMLLQAITIDDRAYEVEKATQVVHQPADLPRRLPAVDGGHRPLTSSATPTCGSSSWRTSPAALRRRRCATGASASSRSDGRARGPRLRRALPASVGALPRLLRGRVRRAAHPGRARSCWPSPATRGGARARPRVASRWRRESPA